MCWINCYNPECGKGIEEEGQFQIIIVDLTMISIVVQNQGKGFGQKGAGLIQISFIFVLASKVVIKMGVSIGDQADHHPITKIGA